MRTGWSGRSPGSGFEEHAARERAASERASRRDGTRRKVSVIERV
jgi:hypothetical protein